jgi:hypothetical protein
MLEVLTVAEAVALGPRWHTAADTEPVTAGDPARSSRRPLAGAS